MRNGLTAILLFVSSTVTLAQSKPCPPNYGYSGFLAAEQWRNVKEWPNCAPGGFQSPIDIKAPFVGRKNRPIHVSYVAMPVTVENSGHDFRVIPSRDNFIVGSDFRAKLDNVHFHVPSEHMIDGKHFDAEAHFVHKTANGKTYVVAVLYSREVIPNGNLEPIIHVLPVDLCKHKNARIETPLLPNAITHYYRYIGSLTTPKCDPNVTFLVMADVQPIGQDQIDALKHFGENARPEQDRRDRDIIEVTP